MQREETSRCSVRLVAPSTMRATGLVGGNFCSAAQAGDRLWWRRGLFPKLLWWSIPGPVDSAEHAGLADGNDDCVASGFVGHVVDTLTAAQPGPNGFQLMSKT